MNGSPATCSEKRVQRAQSTHRSRSSSTWEEIAIGFGYVRLTSRKRESARPLVSAWFCSGHSPPLSQIGQSSGWLTSSSSIVPCWALSATAEDSWVFTTMPSATVVVQEAGRLRHPRPLPASVTSTRHCRQAPMGSSSGWSQNRGIWMPSCSAARMISVPFGTVTSKPSIVRVTSSSTGGSAGRSGARVMSVRSHELGLPQPRRDAAGDVVLVLAAEVLQRGGDRAGRAVTEGAERPAVDVVADVQQLLEVLLGALAVLQPAQ